MDSSRGSGGCGSGQDRGVGDKEVCKVDGQGGHKGSGRVVLIFDSLFISLHVSLTIILTINVRLLHTSTLS